MPSNKRILEPKKSKLKLLKSTFYAKFATFWQMRSGMPKISVLRPNIHKMDFFSPKIFACFDENFSTQYFPTAQNLGIG